MHIDNLIRQHKTIYESIETLETLIRKNNIEQDAFDVSLKLNLLMGTLKIHLQSEDEFLYPALLNSGDDKIKTMAREYIGEMGSISSDFQAYKVQFDTKSKIIGNAQSFIISTTQILKLLKNRLNKEDNLLYPTIENI
ncbi:hemerythrin domain-containing protein [Clostridium oryzae]|uniref:Hemerythrin-like domain-containing protein n=1 Tax=Clostridium oryzae TaxID=1450648 RepID=A0A1V4ILL3_9CLOT|nr:hemerythrin domain-containing protein [Clostridium oryzae]OPJ60759.1 hypothetical protein CLORY_26270 [Clostridium oryzae]